MSVSDVSAYTLRLNKSGEVDEDEIESSPPEDELHLMKQGAQKTHQITGQPFQLFGAGVPASLERMRSEKTASDQDSMGHGSQGSVKDEVESVSSQGSYDPIPLFTRMVTEKGEDPIGGADVMFLPYNSDSEVMPAGFIDLINSKKVFKDGCLYGIFFHNSRKRIVIYYQEKPSPDHTAFKTEISFGNRQSEWATLSAASDSMVVINGYPHVIQLSGRHTVTITISRNHWPYSICVLDHPYAEPKGIGFGPTIK